MMDQESKIDKQEPVLWMPKVKNTYHHLLFQIDRSYGNKQTLEEALEHMFEGGVIPEEGDRIDLVCVKRTDDQIVINLKVAKP